MQTIQLFTVGYGRWPATTRWDRLGRALRDAEVEVLCDIRHSPCSANLNPANSYGPRTWHLQPQGKGIVAALAGVGIEYRWLVELGNPQKNDRQMVVLREHLEDSCGHWPVRRGLEILKQLAVAEAKRCCLMCACKRFDRCHRKIVAEQFVSFAAPSAVTVTEIE